MTVGINKLLDGSGQVTSGLYTLQGKSGRWKQVLINC